MPGDRSSSSPRRNDRSRSGGPNRGTAGRDGRRSQSKGGRDERFKADRKPLTEADRRSMDVKRRRGPKPEPDRDAERAREREKIEARTTEEWVDEGSVRETARAAARRASAAPRERRAPEPLDPSIESELKDALGAQRGTRLSERLARASEALDRERFDEAKRIAAAIAKEAPGVAAAHEIVGLANYRLGRFRPAATALELANDLHENPSILPPLADSYRALKRWSSVDRIWMQIRNASPAHDVLSEGRIVAAGALADRGDIPAAIELMRAGTENTRSKKSGKVKDHHLRQWYVLADLYDQINDPINARRWFGKVAEVDADFFDVQTRLRHIGR